MKHIKIFENDVNEEANKVNQIVSILHKVLKPGTDKGSTQGIIDTKDFKLAAEEIQKLFIK